MPEDLQPPEVMDGFGDWIDAFWSLSTERQIGMGVGPIPDSAIDRHAAGWGWEDADMFRFCIRQMDRVYLARATSDDAPPAAGSAREAFRKATASQRGR